MYRMRTGYSEKAAWEERDVIEGRLLDRTVSTIDAFYPIVIQFYLKCIKQTILKYNNFGNMTLHLKQLETSAKRGSRLLHSKGK